MVTLLFFLLSDLQKYSFREESKNGDFVRLTREHPSDNIKPRQANHATTGRKVEYYMGIVWNRADCLGRLNPMRGSVRLF